MSKRISEIQSEVEGTISKANQVIQNSEPVGNDIGEVMPRAILINEKETIPQLRYKTVYTYKGSERESWQETNDLRNADIDSKIAKTDTKISDCNNKKNELNKHKSDCEESIKNLEADVQLLNRAQKEFSNIASNMRNSFAGFENSKGLITQAYKCSPTNLQDGTTNSIRNMTVRNFSSNSISDGISSLERFIQTGQEIKQNLENLVTKLDSKISVLEKSRNSFEGMKR